MSTLIGFTILFMFGLFIYVVRELFIKRRLYMVFILWFQIFAITLGISAFVQDVKSSDFAELIYVVCGLLAPCTVILHENWKSIDNVLDLKAKGNRVKYAFVSAYKKVIDRSSAKIIDNKSIDLTLLPIDSVSPDNPEGYLTLGDEYNEAGLFEEAIDCYKRYVELRNNSIEGYIKIGVAYENLGNISEAIRAYRRCVYINPRFIEGYIYLGQCYCHISDYIAAIDMYMNAIKQNSENFNLYFHLGITCEQCKRYPEAAKAYEMALELSPCDEEAIYHLGAVLTELRKYDEAISAYKSALEVKPSDSELFYNLSVVYSLLEKPEIAIDNLKKAVELNSCIKYTALQNKAFDCLKAYPEFKRAIGLY